MINLVDVPRAHRNHDVARAGFIVYCCCHPVKVGTKPRRSAGAGNFVRQLTRERVGFVSANLPRSVHRGNQNLIGPLKARGKLRQQGPQSGDLVWLKKAPEAPPPVTLAGRLESRPHFGRMMGEVVDPGRSRWASPTIRIAGRLRGTQPAPPESRQIPSRFHDTRRSPPAH